MTPTEKMLVEIYGGPILDTDDLAKVFRYESARVVRDLIHQERFPVKTFKLSDHQQSRVVANVADVAAYLDGRRNVA